MPKKKRTIESHPLTMTQEWSRLYPTIWKEIDIVAEFFSQKFKPWEPICMVPTEVTTFVLATKHTEIDVSLGVALQVIYAWRKFKKVYSINQELAELLMKSAEDSAILTENVMQLPFPAIYIEFDGWLFDDTFIGAFINFDCPYKDAKMEERVLELQISMVSKVGGIRVLPLIVQEGYSIFDSCKHYFDLALAYKNEKMSKPRQDELIDDAKIASRMIQIVLYLCAVNAEIEENPVQKKIYQKSTAQKKTKDVLREVEKFDVGVRIGNAIRLHKKAKTNVEVEEVGVKAYKKGTKKRPHVRRSHFHNFWVGSGENRHLELRFLAPSYINFAADFDDSNFDVVKHEIVE